jgi:hypothetical protein
VTATFTTAQIDAGEHQRTSPGVMTLAGAEAIEQAAIRAVVTIW